MESRKSQLQKQITEALNANDNDLYSLLKSQWAHRFGVESLEELKNLDLNQLNESSNNLDNHKTDQSKENIFDGNKEISIEDEDKKEKEINTFFRLSSPTVILKLQQAFTDMSDQPSPKEVFLKLRELRNSW